MSLSLAPDRRNVGVVTRLERPVVAPGALPHHGELQHGELHDPPLVAAADLAGARWWIAAVAVWSDDRREHPRPIGLATRPDRHVAVLAGLSDRLGWEAELARRRGVELRRVEGLGAGRCDDAVVHDGRIGHDVPTVLVVSDRATFWGSGATMAAAYHRALFGDRGELGGRAELAEVGAILATAGLTVGAVDLSTPVMTAGGVHRLSVQLLLASHEPGRSWDGAPLD